MPGSQIELLIIDDCAEDREMARALLFDIPERSYRLYETANAAEGAVVLGERRFDCILLDYRLPDKDGLFLLRQFTQGEGAINCPVVLMTGNADTGTSLAALEYGAQDFLPKNGLTAQVLDRTIQHAMVRFRLMRERQLARSVLATKEQLLQMVQESGGIGIFEWNLDTQETRFNGAYFKMYGLPSDHPPLSFGQWLELVHPDDRTRVQRETEQAIAALREFSYEYRVIWPDRSLHWILARGAAAGTLEGMPVRVAGVNLDITAVKSAEGALMAANRELQQFAFTAGHDLQAPLRSIGVFTELLERKFGSDTDGLTRQAITHVRAGVQRMHSLVGDLLVYAQAGAPPGSGRRNQPLQCALANALESLECDIRSSGAAVTSDELPTIPSFGDEFMQVFQNLIGNAIRYRRAEIPPSIHISVVRRSQDWVIAVTDNGQGFDMSNASSIFQPFKRLDGAKAAGTGLGLAICKRIVERNGGQIWAHSQAGAGASFFFSVPLAEGEQAADADPNSAWKSTVA